jgi:hypothetical protein
MMSRTTYKQMRVDWYPDECAAPLPKSAPKAYAPVHEVPSKVVPLTNRYMVLNDDDDETRADSDKESESYITGGIGVTNWADAAVA